MRWTAPERHREAGVTIIETVLSLAILGVLVSSVFSIALETSNFVRDSDQDVFVQTEGNLASQRLFEVLRKTGRVTIGGTAYPRVTSGGAALEFRVLRDLDANGYAFDAATGQLEWDPSVYTIAADAGGNLGISLGGTVVFRLARYVSNLGFATFNENPALHINEIQISFEIRRPTGNGYDAVQAVNTSVHMRN